MIAGTSQPILDAKQLCLVAIINPYALETIFRKENPEQKIIFFSLPIAKQCTIAKIFTSIYLEKSLVISHYFAGKDFNNFMKALSYKAPQAEVTHAPALTWMQKLQSWCGCRSRNDFVAPSIKSAVPEQHRVDYTPGPSTSAASSSSPVDAIKHSTSKGLN